MNPVQFNYQQQYQQIPIEHKTCQRARGSSTENEVYCGRSLPISHFAKGRSQCKECNTKVTKNYNLTNINKFTEQITMMSQQLSYYQNAYQTLYQQYQELEKSKNTQVVSQDHLARIKALEDEKLYLENEYNSQANKYSELFNSYENLKQDQIEDEKLLEKMQGEINILNTKLGKKEETISSLQNDNSILKDEKVDLQDQIRVLKRKLNLA